MLLLTYLRFFISSSAICLLLWMSPSISTAQTTINRGEIYGTLKKSGSPYRIMGNLRVPKDSVLTIEAGVVLEFDTVKFIRIDGVLKVEGSINDPVLFTCPDSMIGWSGLFFLDNKGQDTSKFIHAILEYVSGAKVSNDPFINQKLHANGQYIIPYVICAFNPSPLVLVGCKLRHNRFTFNVWDTDFRVINCEIYQNRKEFSNYSNGTIAGIKGCHFELINAYIHDNTVSGWYTGDNLKLQNPGFVENCLFENNVGEFEMDNTRFPIRNCHWKNNKCIVLRMAGGNSQLIENCVFEGTYGSCNFGGDIRVQGDASASVFKNCTFKDKKDYTVTATIQSGSPMFLNCVFENNLYGLYYPTGSSNGRIVNCLFVGNDECFNIASDVVIVNSSFINNKNHETDPYGTTFLDSSSGSGRTISGGRIKDYNSIFWGNTDNFGRTLNFTIMGSKEDHLFQNCIIQGGIASINKTGNPSYVYTGGYNSNDTSAPIFVDMANKDFHLLSNCSGTSPGFNQGFTDPIPMFYRGTNYSDILKGIAVDMDNKARIYDGHADIGAYEIQSIGSRIDLVDTLNGGQACEGGSIVLRGTASSIGLKTEWQKKDKNIWAFEASSTNELELKNLSASDNGSLYRVKWENECQVERFSDSVGIVVFSAPNWALPADTTITAKDKINISGPANFKQYAWSNGDTTSSITIDGSEIGIGTYTFICEVKDKNGCYSDDSIIVTVTKNIGYTNFFSQQINIYPNPSKDFIHFSEGVTGSYRILDASGRTVDEGRVNRQAIDIRWLHQGIYFLEIIHSNNKLNFIFSKKDD